MDGDRKAVVTFLVLIGIVMVIEKIRYPYPRPNIMINETFEAWLLRIGIISDMSVETIDQMDGKTYRWFHNYYISFQLDPSAGQDPFWGFPPHERGADRSRSQSLPFR